MALPNNYVAGRSWADLKNYTNPTTAEENALKSKLTRMPCCDDAPTPNTDILVDGTGANTTFTENQIGANEVRYYNVRINDQSGNFAAGSFDVATMAALVVDTSGLNLNDNWTVIVEAGLPGAGDECDCTAQGELQIVGTKPNAAANINFVQSAGTLSLQVQATNNGVEIFAKATVADAGTAALGAISVGDTTLVNVYFLETAGAPLTIQNIATAMTEESKIYLQAIIAPNGEIAGYQVSVDTSAPAAISETITVTSNDPANPSYVITITATVS